MCFVRGRISFSVSKERAMYWCSDRETLNLTPCEEYYENRYIFILDLCEKDLTDHGFGIYQFRYNCNPALKASNLRSQNPSPLESTLKNQKCPLCANSKLNHIIVLINSYKYLSNNSNHQGFRGAIDYAKADQEWLVLPYDSINNSKYLEARIPRADFWTVEHYVGSSK